MIQPKFANVKNTASRLMELVSPSSNLTAGDTTLIHNVEEHILNESIGRPIMDKSNIFHNTAQFQKSRLPYRHVKVWCSAHLI